jgi:ribonucleotide monophosphatase NagD (HAD superfamily)
MNFPTCHTNLNHAFRLLLDGAELVATGDNRYFKASGQYWLDAGPFVRALEYAVGVEARVMGKPSTDFYAQILADADLQAAEVIMLGDDIHGDIEGALSAGLQACLVQSGKYRPGDEEKIVGAFSATPSLQAWVTQQGL